MSSLQGWTAGPHDLTLELPAPSGATDGVAMARREIAGRCDRAPALLGAAAADFGRRAAQAALSPDELLGRLEAGVYAWLGDPAAGTLADAAAADAVVLHLWRFARDAYHDTRAALAAGAARRTSRDRSPRMA